MEVTGRAMSPCTLILLSAQSNVQIQGQGAGDKTPALRLFIRSFTAQGI